MKVFVSGATGVAGLPAVRRLVQAGHEVRAVARDEEKAARLAALGAEPVAVDLFDAAAVCAAVGGAQAVLHLATSIPPMSRMRRSSAWNVHNALRTTATRALVDAARAHDAELFVKESITFTYPDSGERWITEDDPPGESVRPLRPTLAGERIAQEFAAGGGRAVVLRFGSFYGPTARAVDEYLTVARRGIAPVVGRPGAYVSSIHTDDVASAIVAVLDAPGGVYNVVDDEPLTRRAYADAFAEAFGLRRLRLAPPWLFRLVGGSGAAALLASQRVSNRKLRDTTGWSPLYRSARESWAQVAAARRESSTRESS